MHRHWGSTDQREGTSKKLVLHGVQWEEGWQRASSAEGYRETWLRLVFLFERQARFLISCNGVRREGWAWKWTWERRAGLQSTCAMLENSSFLERGCRDVWGCCRGITVHVCGRDAQLLYSLLILAIREVVPADGEWRKWCQRKTKRKCYPMTWFANWEATTSICFLSTESPGHPWVVLLVRWWTTLNKTLTEEICK